MLKIAEMNRTELRAACKAAGIQYSKLTVDGMRKALFHHEDNQYYVKKCGTANCPHCNVHLSNGLLHADDGDGNGDPLMLKHEWFCMGCGEEFGEELPADYYTVKPVADRHTGSGLKIEKARPEQNGVKRPSAGGKCRAVWDALDELLSELEAGEAVTAKMVKDLAADEGWNANNASIEFYNWRKFNGISGRSK